MKLIDQRTGDGSRCFVEMPHAADWVAVGRHVPRLPGAATINFINDQAAPAWLDFSFREHRFRVQRGNECLYFYVDDPQCPDLILFEVASHFDKLRSF